MAAWWASADPRRFLAVLVVAAAGWWFLKMWQTFGNPLFPQFNNLFRSPLAEDGGVIDVFFRPQGWMENLLWPFIFSYNSKRVIEIALTQLIWPMVYLAGVALALRLLRDAIVGQRPADTLERGPWWQLFGDPVLNQLAESIEVNNEIHQYPHLR